MPVTDGDEGVWEDPPQPVANVSPTPPGPGPSSPAPDHSTEPHRVTDDGAGSDQGEAATEEPLPEFDPKVRDDFEGLLYLGALTAEFEWMGHKFLIRTLKVGEVLEVGLLHREYVGTVTDVKAYQAAVVAACVLQIDGRSMPFPITMDDQDTMLRNRFQYVLDKWFPPTLDAVYENYLLLEARVERVMEAMGKAYGWTFTTRTLSGVAA